MSQDKFLGEDEVRNLINESLNLKLEKSAFLKPSSEVVCQIYARFLDLTLKDKWRNYEKDGYKPPFKINMNGWLRHLFEPYNVGFEFNLNDLVMPTRKRTMAFLNIIIHIRLVIEEGREAFNRRAEELRENQAAVAKIEEEIEREKLLREELAYKKSLLDSQLERNGDLQDVFNKKKAICDELSEQGAILKQQAKEAAEIKQRRREELESLKQKVATLEDQARRLDEGLDLEPRKAELQRTLESLKSKRLPLLTEIQELQDKTKKKEELSAIIATKNKRNRKRLEEMRIAIETHNYQKTELEERARKLNTELDDVESENSKLATKLKDSQLAREKAKIQYKIKQEDIKSKIIEVRSQMDKREEEVRNKSQELENAITGIQRERDRIHDEYKRDSNKRNAMLEKSNRMFKDLKKRYEEALRDEQAATLRHQKQSTFVQNFIGKPSGPETQVNCTYIKDTKSTPSNNNNTYIKETAK